MYQVVKRDGKIVDFNLQKISDAIRLAFEAEEKQFHPSVIDFLALKVTADFEPKIKDSLVAVEDIQDSVENVLVQAGYSDVAKAYILYRRQREKLRQLKSTVLDYKDVKPMIGEEIQILINTPKAINKVQADTFPLRRAAIERNLPVLTCMDTARIFAIAVEKKQKGQKIEYRAL